MIENNILLQIVIIAAGIFFVSFILRLLKQPHVIAYIIGGIVLGPYGLNIISNRILLENIGQLGLILLLFFTGMEVCLPCLASNWRITIFASVLQILLSVAISWLLGLFFSWTFATILLLGFVISLSSTAVVIKFLEAKKELNTKIGQNVVGILVVQDIAVVPMLIILNLITGDKISSTAIAVNIIGGILFMGLMMLLVRKKEIKFFLPRIIRQDKELQVFGALLLGFGFAVIASLIGLSPALGAFFAGFIVASAKETHWVKRNLHPFYIILAAIFFVYIGILIDIDLLRTKFFEIALLVVAIFLINNVINFVAFRILGINWNESLYGGALLSQIGEFSFVLAAVGLQNNLVSLSGYNLIILLISLTMLLGPIWIWIIRKHTQVRCVGRVCTYRE